MSRRSQRAFLSMLLILGIIHHAVEQQIEVMLQQRVSQQNSTVPVIRVFDDVPLLLGVEEKRTIKLGDTAQFKNWRVHVEGQFSRFSDPTNIQVTLKAM